MTSGAFSSALAVSSAGLLGRRAQFLYCWPVGPRSDKCSGRRETGTPGVCPLRHSGQRTAEPSPNARCPIDNTPGKVRGSYIQCFFT